MNFVPLCLLANIFKLFKFINAIPMDFCFYRLNTSDCELRPTPVFTYYKPGSRCEIEIWRGCPTYNKFENEFECSHACIGRLNPSFSAENNEIDDKEESEQCKEVINLDDCGQEEEEVYTFNNEKGVCEAVQWKGCETENKFEDKDSCKDACKHLMKDDESESSEEETKDEDKKETGSDDKKSTEKGSSEKAEGSEDKKSGDEEKAEEDAEEKNDDGGDTEKLKNADEDEGDPEETSSVRRSRGNQTLENANGANTTVL